VTDWTSLLPFLGALQRNQNMPDDDDDSTPPADPTGGMAAGGQASLQQSNSATATKAGRGQTDTAPAPPTPPGAGPIASDPTAMNAFLAGLDNHKVGQYTVAQLANVLTNESRDLTFVGPPTPDGHTPLTDAKTVQAHSIINNASQTRVNAMAVPRVTAEVSNSPAYQQNLQIMRQAYYDQMTGQPDPAEGRTYFGNSAENLHSRPIGNSRQSVFKQFGPFRWGSNPPQYIYIYNDPGK
jgi:hypothetical protein